MNTKYAPLVLRVGLAFVFFWFGFSQLNDQTMWVGLIPTWIVSLTGMSAKAIVIANGIFEVIMASLLCLGVAVRIVALLLALHLFTIVLKLGMNAVGVRDVGLLCALVSVMITGKDQFALALKQQLQ